MICWREDGTFHRFDYSKKTWPGTLVGAEKGDADPTGKRAGEKGEEGQRVEKGNAKAPR